MSTEAESVILSPDELERLFFAIEQTCVQHIVPQELMQLGQLVAKEHSQWSRLFAERHCVPGEIIFWENVPGDSVYIIQSGKAVVVKGKLTSPVILGCQGSGEMIGEMALLESSSRSATVIALEKTRLLEISRENFFKLLRTSDTFSREIMRLLSTRLRDTSDAVQRETMEKIRDPLTGLHNRYYLWSIFAYELQRAERVRYPVCIILLDIDNFKDFNDTYGHPAGDQILKTLGRMIRLKVRHADIACRYGGDEFLIVLPEAALDVALARAETIRARCDDLQVEYEGQTLHCTVSAGVACFPDHATTPDTLIQAADRALYTAKRQGRNQFATIPDDK